MMVLLMLTFVRLVGEADGGLMVLYLMVSS